MGGMSALTATVHAYVSDVTPDGSRAAAFARLTGAVMAGFSAGPMLGAIIIRATDNM